jgi:hypothetical protein
MTLSDKEALRIIVDPARRLLAGPAVARLMRSTNGDRPNNGGQVGRMCTCASAAGLSATAGASV